ncbi:hypothetical protein EKH55_1678 [Sinorhizobium alkalisoli]|nr:hypothetical protein EKH55_1678 [Sinorhizobium alkalisoli]
MLPSIPERWPFGTISARRTVFAFSHFNVGAGPERSDSETGMGQGAARVIFLKHESGFDGGKWL